MTVAMEVITAGQIKKFWPVPGVGDDKYSRGVVGVDTGSLRYLGAGVLSTLGAVRSGAGFVRFVGPKPTHAALLARCPSVTFGQGRVAAWVVGCGWDDELVNGPRLAARLADGVPCVIDAGAMFVIEDALAALGTSKLPGGALLTPHAGELARLLEVRRADVTADPLRHAQLASRRFGAAVLLKGATQFCVDHDIAYQVPPGPAWTAQAGSGDVLAGVAGTLLAAGLKPALAGALAAALQAQTAARHLGPWAPDQLADWFPQTIAEPGFTDAARSSA